MELVTDSMRVVARTVPNHKVLLLCHVLTHTATQLACRIPLCTVKICFAFGAVKVAREFKTFSFIKSLAFPIKRW